MGSIEDALQLRPTIVVPGSQFLSIPGHIPRALTDALWDMRVRGVTAVTVQELLDICGAKPTAVQLYETACGLRVPVPVAMSPEGTPEVRSWATPVALSPAAAERRGLSYVPRHAPEELHAGATYDFKTDLRGMTDGEGMMRWLPINHCFAPLFSPLRERLADTFGAEWRIHVSDGIPNRNLYHLTADRDVPLGESGTEGMIARMHMNLSAVFEPNPTISSAGLGYSVGTPHQLSHVLARRQFRLECTWDQTTSEYRPKASASWLEGEGEKHGNASIVHFDEQGNPKMAQVGEVRIPTREFLKHVERYDGATLNIGQVYQRFAESAVHELFTNQQHAGSPIDYAATFDRMVQLMVAPKVSENALRQFSPVRFQ